MSISFYDFLLHFCEQPSTDLYSGLPTPDGKRPLRERMFIAG